MDSLYCLEILGMMEEGEDFDAFEHRSSSTPASEVSEVSNICVMYFNDVKDTCCGFGSHFDFDQSIRGGVELQVELSG